MTVADLKREVLVRHLEAWAPAALHRARRATYVHGYPGTGSEAALQVFAELSDLVRGRELTMLAFGADIAPDGARLAPGLTVHPVPGELGGRLGVVLKAVGAARVPLLGFLDASGASEPPGPAVLGALAAGRPAEVLVVYAPGAAGDVAARRVEFEAAGFPLVTAVELATGEEPGELLIFATGQGKSLESFKDTLWAVDEYAGVRYRDPGDPERHLIDITLEPHPGPLRRELLAHLARAGECTVTELRTYALTRTVYRAADATRVVQALLQAGAVTRRPEQGRLGGDVVIAAAQG